MRRLLLLASLLLLAVHAAPAHAATVEIQGTVLRFTAAAGEENHPILHYRAEDELVVYDSDFRKQTVIAGPGCSQDGDNTVICPRAGLVRADVALGDRAVTALVPDSLTLTAAVPLPVNATASTGAAARVGYIDLRPVEASLDGLPNDGPGQRGDNLGPGIDGVLGGDGTDTITGNDRANTLDGDNGADQLRGEAGDDVITAASFNNVGADAVGLESRGADTISCGPGSDTVYFDASDTLADDCGLLVRVDDEGYTYIGTAGGDRIIADRGPATVNGGAGNDRLGATRLAGDVRLSGEGGSDRLAGNTANDFLHGGTGDDSLAGAEGDDRLDGGRGRDGISGGAGRDRIQARDGSTDTIRCGSGRDSVTADRSDRVARDCERVSRG